MDRSEKETYRSELVRLQEKASKLLDAERNYTRELNPLKESRDTGDYGKATVDLEMDLLSQEAIGHILAQTEQALRKIESGTYGICDRCKREIHRGRLRALPYTPLCVECQEKMERGGEK
ncbi:MAG TPA: TraR/DksA family transcriptional regulator [Atribacteraceae bacterium]|nr:TraR/DksA family transcriptional regulator [Atribacteraceae bacterium]